MKLTLSEETDLLRAVTNAERGNRGEVRLHLEARCVGEPLARARAVYERLGMRATQGDTGVLLYVATASRVCAVYSGAGVVSRPPEGFWKGVTDAVASGFAGGAPVKGLLEGLRRIGDMLRAQVPGDDVAGDELPNTLSTEADA